MQQRRNSIANALELCLSCTNPSINFTGEIHYNDVIMGAIASQITRLTSGYSTVYSDADQRKHQSFASLAFVWGIHRGPHKWPITRKRFPFDDVIMLPCQKVYIMVQILDDTATVSRQLSSLSPLHVTHWLNTDVIWSSASSNYKANIRLIS